MSWNSAIDMWYDRSGEATSEKIKINYKMAQNIISCNRNNIRLEAVYNIARSLNISIDDLLFKNIFKN